MSLSVADTTVLSNFATVGRVALVPRAFPDVVAPVAVFDELAEGERLGRFPPQDWAWLPEVRLTAEELRAVEEFSASLGHGESACLAIASARKALLLTDDQAARRRARSVGIEFSGSIGVLSRLVEQEGLNLREADSLLGAMVEAGYWSPVRSLREVVG